MTKKLKFIWLLVAVASFSAFSEEISRNCHQRVIAFDIGSGSSRMRIARSNICETAQFSLNFGKKTLSFNQDIQIADLETLFDDDAERSVAYADAVEKDRNNDGIQDGIVDTETQKEGLNAILDLLGLAYREKLAFEASNPTAPVYKDRMIGVMTSAMRIYYKNDAKGAKKFVRSMKDLGFDDLAIISQETEARLGFVAAVNAANIQNPKSTVVWDIGGKSMQVVAADAEGNVQIIGQGNMASNDFKNAVISQVKPANWMHSFANGEADKVPNPNPLTKTEMTAAVSLSETFACEVSYQNFNVCDFVRKNSIERFVGIGGVIKYGGYKRLNDLGVTEGKTFTPEEQTEGLSLMVNGAYNKSGDFASGDVTNMALVLGHMNAWGVNELQATGSTMADALLLNPSLKDWDTFFRVRIW